MNEIRVLQSHFPEARVLICYFHVRKYLKEMSGNKDFGAISRDDRNIVDMVVGKLIRSADDTIFAVHWTSLVELCTRIGFQGFVHYMDRNWNNCKDMWVVGRRSQLPHFRNATNNMLESWFGKFKGCVSSDYSMAQCIKSLVETSTRTENEYKYHKDRLGRNVNAGYDEEMSNVLRLTTHFLAGQIESQYSSGLENANSYVFEERDGSDVVIVRGHSRTSIISKLDWSCDCDFAASMKLPCRHVIAFRKHANVPGPVIPWSRIDERYVTSRSDPDSYQDSSRIIS
jgi:hypothetical protein